MHREEAGIPTEAPRDIRMAEYSKMKVGPRQSKAGAKTLTNIAPDWCPVNGVVSPSYRINALVEAG